MTPSLNPAPGPGRIVSLTFSQTTFRAGHSWTDGVRGLVARPRRSSAASTPQLPPGSRVRVVSAFGGETRVSQEGFEPTTKRLRVSCSTAELLAPRNGT